MQATQILMAEHRIIERVIAVLDTAAQRVEQNQTVRPGFFLDAADFIKGFADGCHHRKEEGVLFKAMIAHGVPDRGGPIGVMMDEHEQGRAYTQGMRQATQTWLSGDPSARAAIVANARGYATLLRQHIRKEDNILFPMADRVIPASEHDQILADFEKVEHEETGPGVHEKYLAIAKNLENEVKG
jgi:hemerythrin-like domain-containing protein